MDKGVEAANKMFLLNRAHGWLALKVKILQDILNSPEKHLPYLKSLNDETTLLYFKEGVKLDIICSTVHLCEIFAIYLINFRERKENFVEKLLNYKISEVKDFYRGIGKRNINYITSCFLWPPFSSIENSFRKKEMLTSSQLLKAELKRIAKFYRANVDIYNSYKHGLRAFPFVSTDAEGNLFGCIANFTDKNDCRKIKIGVFQTKECIEICNFINEVLNGLFESYEQLSKNKDAYTVTIWSKRQQSSAQS